jgi:hypothetical protein
VSSQIQLPQHGVRVSGFVVEPHSARQARRSYA